MYRINQFDLISGSDIPIKNIGTLHQPTLDEIRQLGYEKYVAYINILMVDFDTFLDKANVSPEVIEATKLQTTIFELLFYEDKGRVLFKEALSFFIIEHIECDVINGRFVLTNRDTKNITGYIDKSNYGQFRNHFLQINYAGIDETEISNLKFRNEKERKKYEKLMKSKKDARKRKKVDKDINLPNMISSVSAQHNSYNLTNIWSLTVYQLYDQFFRLNSKTQMDVIGLRWAAWGKEDFDFSVWYKDINSKK